MLKDLQRIIELAMLAAGYNGLSTTESIAAAILANGYHL